MTTKTRFAKIISLVLAVMMLSTFVFTIAACDDDSDKQYYDNETDKLVFSTQEVDKVFNPFFSTSAQASKQQQSTEDYSNSPFHNNIPPVIHISVKIRIYVVMMFPDFTRCLCLLIIYYRPLYDNSCLTFDCVNLL